MIDIARYLLPTALAVVAIVAAGSDAAACDMCRRLGSASHHLGPIGGDNVDDAMVSPAQPFDEGGATAQFVLQGGQWPQPGGPGSPITLTYSFQNMFDGELRMPNGLPLPVSLIRQSIVEALQLWANVAPINFVEVPDDHLDYFQGATQYGQLRFRHVYINGPDPPVGDPIAKAQAYFPFSGDPYAGDVEFDHSDPWQEIGTLPAPDILGAAVHEIGHTLGLGHTGLPAANMYWIFRRSAGLGTAALHADDIAGVRAIYGSGSGSVTQLIPEPATWALVFAAVIVGAVLGRTRRVAAARFS